MSSGLKWYESGLKLFRKYLFIQTNRLKSHFHQNQKDKKMFLFLSGEDFNQDLQGQGLGGKISDSIKPSELSGHRANSWCVSRRV